MLDDAEAAAADDEDDAPVDAAAAPVDKERERPGEAPAGDYGIDAPTIVKVVSYAAVAALAATVIIGIINVLWLMVTMFLISAALTLLALGMVRFSRVTKVRMRKRIVDLLRIEGDARVLDVGCGRGLLTVEAARRMDEDGIAVGIDIWRLVDQSENDPEAVYENADIERVNGQVEVVTSEARALPFPDASFDAAVSQLAIHNIHSAHGRTEALREMDRVLAPGARLVIVDLRHTRRYVEVFRALNWTGIERKRLGGRMRGMRLLTGTKPIVESGTIQWPLPEPVAAPSTPEPESEPAPELDALVVAEAVEPADEDTVAASTSGTETGDHAVS